MKIIRDGKEYELTTYEIFEAAQEFERNCCIEDIDNYLEAYAEDFEEFYGYSVKDADEIKNYILNYYMKYRYTMYWEDALKNAFEQAKGDVI